MQLFDFQDARHISSNTQQKYREIVRQMNASLYRQSYGKMWLVGGEVYDWQQSPYYLSALAGVSEPYGYAGSRNAAILAGYVTVPCLAFGVYAGDVWPVAFPTIGVAIVGENWGLVTFMHEFGHLIGLPDVYNPELVKEWDVMALTGSPSGEVSTTRAEFSAWSRIQLGWLTSDDVESVAKTTPATVVEIKSIDEPSGTRAVTVPLPTPPQEEAWWEATQYLVVIEARSTTLVIYHFTGYKAIQGWGYLELYNFTRLAVIQILNEERSSKRVYTGESAPINADIGVVLVDTQPDSLRIKLTSNADAKKGEEALAALDLASRSLHGILLKGNELNEAWESFRNGDFAAATSLAGKAKSQASFLAILQPIILVLLLACPIAGILLYNRRRKSAKTTMKPTPTQALGTKYCRACGAKIPRDSTYCEECGKKLV